MYDYQEFYKECVKLNEERSDMVSSQVVSSWSMKMAEFYGTYSLELFSRWEKVAQIAKDIELKMDDNGKMISSTKAKIITEATSESLDHELYKTHVKNIETYIFALKAKHDDLLKERR